MVGTMVEAALEAAKSGYLTAMYEAAKSLLDGSVAVSYGDVHLVADHYVKVLEKKRSILRILTSTVHFSCELSEIQLETINGRRTRLANRMGPVIQCLVALFDRVKLSSPDKRNVHKMINELMAMLAEIGCSDISGISAGANVEISAVSESGYGSAARAPSAENMALGSQDDISRSETLENERPGFERLKMDLDSAALVMEKRWIPRTLPVILGEVTDYSKNALKSFAEEYDGHCRIFIHFGLIFVRRRPTNVHSTVAGTIGTDLMEAFNRGLERKQFVLSTETTATYVHRFGCGYEVPKTSDVGLTFSCLTLNPQLLVRTLL